MRRSSSAACAPVTGRSSCSRLSHRASMSASRCWGVSRAISSGDRTAAVIDHAPFLKPMLLAPFRNSSIHIVTRRANAVAFGRAAGSHCLGVFWFQRQHEPSATIAPQSLTGAETYSSVCSAISRASFPYDAQVPNRALQLCMPQQRLHCPPVLGAPVRMPLSFVTSSAKSLKLRTS